MGIRPGIGVGIGIGLGTDVNVAGRIGVWLSEV